VSLGSRVPRPSQLGSVVEWCACCSATSVATRSRHREFMPGWGVLSIDTHEVAGAREALRGFPGASPEAHWCCDAKPIGTLCVPKVPGVSCLAGSVGIAPWRQRRGRVPAEPHIGRAFRAADQRRWLFLLPLTSRRHRRATAGGVGVSNR
jgi:hypothetical protein